MISMQNRHIVRIYKIGLMIGAHIGSERSGGSRRCRGSSERQEEDLVGGDGKRRGEEALERLRIETDTLELTKLLLALYRASGRQRPRIRLSGTGEARVWCTHAETEELQRCMRARKTGNGGATRGRAKAAGIRRGARIQGVAGQAEAATRSRNRGRAGASEQAGERQGRASGLARLRSWASGAVDWLRPLRTVNATGAGQRSGSSAPTTRGLGIVIGQGGRWLSEA
jgi:hypothetical protein